jgi:hypothetical protein
MEQSDEVRSAIATGSPAASQMMAGRAERCARRFYLEEWHDASSQNKHVRDSIHNNNDFPNIASQKAYGGAIHRLTLAGL